LSNCAKERFCQPAIILAIKEAEKAGFISIALIVRAINDRGDPSYRPAIPPGKERMNLSVEAIERCLLKIFYNASRKRRDA
jgi:hypothetical protein